MNEKNFNPVDFLPREVSSQITTGDSEKIRYYINLLFYEKKHLYDYSNKYKNYFFQARTMMHDLLYKEYDLSESFGKESIFPFTPSQITQKPNRKGEVIIKSYFKDKIDLSKTMKEHFNTFLKSFENSSIGLKYVGDEKYRVYYVNYLDALIFSLMFIYQDGRNYSDYISDKKPFPRFRPEQSASIFSYKTLYNMAMTMYDKRNSSLVNDEDFIFYMIQLHKIDTTFKFFKINAINIARKKFMEDNNLEKICKQLDLKYRDIINLEKTLVTEIFEDGDFIKDCLETEFNDPLLVFSILLETYLNLLKIKKLSTKEGDYDYQPGNEEFLDSGITVNNMKLTDLITFCKRKTIQFIKDVISGIEAKMVYECSPNFDMEYWITHYFKNKDLLIDYAKTAVYGEVEENSYMDYLANMVIKILPKSCYR